MEVIHSYLNSSHDSIKQIVFLIGNKKDENLNL